MDSRPMVYPLEDRGKLETIYLFRVGWQLADVGGGDRGCSFPSSDFRRQGPIRIEIPLR